MAASPLLARFRRSRPLSSLSTARVSHLLTNVNPNPNPDPNPLPSQPPIPSHYSHKPHSVTLLSAFHFISSRSFSTRSDDDSEIFATNSASESRTDSEAFNSGLEEAIEGAVNGSSSSFVGGGNGVEESILPFQAVISLLDAYHDLTSLPW